MLLDGFVDRCRALVAGASAEREIAAAVRELMADPERLQAEIAPLANVDPVMGGEDTLFEDDHLAVMVLETPPGFDQPPHDHAMTAIIGVFEGAEDHRLFRLDGDRAVATGTRLVAPGETLVLGPQAIHAIAAEGDTTARAIHVYLGPISTVERSMFDPDTLVVEPMDLDRYAEYCRPKP